MDIVRIDSNSDLDDMYGRETIVEFLHESLKPFHDMPGEIDEGLRYAFSEDAGKGGFLLIADEDGDPVGALVMLETGMSGYVPENLLLYVAVKPDMRGRGIGGRIIERAIEECDGDVKLHVEYDNPAKRLYERLGFVSKYADMRYTR